MLKILSIIPARGGSTEIPLKNLVKINKKPLLHYTLSASLNSSLINRTVVSTDNNKINNFAVKLGAEVIHRPKKLSGNKIALEPTISHVLSKLKSTESYVPDIIVLLQNTSPLRTSTDIDNAVKKFKRSSYDSLLSGFVSHSLYFYLNNKYLKPKNFSLQKWPNRQQMKSQYVGNGAIFITTHTAFQKSKCRISGKIGFYEMPLERSYEIDSNHDLFIVDKLLKKRK